MCAGNWLTDPGQGGFARGRLAVGVVEGGVFVSQRLAVGRHCQAVVAGFLVALAADELDRLGVDLGDRHRIIGRAVGDRMEGAVGGEVGDRRDAGGARIDAVLEREFVGRLLELDGAEVGDPSAVDASRLGGGRLDIGVGGRLLIAGTGAEKGDRESRGHHAIHLLFPCYPAHSLPL